MSKPSHQAILRRPFWPWLALALGFVWTVLIRVPLILNAENHLDSDLAVDGLTLLDAVEGRWRWHYPGTPHMGIVPVLLSYPQALIWGANPWTLVSGGTVAWVLVIGATFWLSRRMFGPETAAWAIFPLVVSSVGMIWLSGRITGGHLLTLAWHVAAFGGLHVVLTKGGTIRGAVLGLGCGLGLYLDTMFLFTLAGMVPAAAWYWWRTERTQSGVRTAAAFVLAAIVGIGPGIAGRVLDPYDAYGEQFAVVRDPSVQAEHARLLVQECLPRLFSGHLLPDFRVEPDQLNWAGQPIRRVRSETHLLDMLTTVLGLLSSALAFGWFAGKLFRSEPPARAAVRRGVVIASGLIAVAFIINQNIYNSDNYRYLVFLMLPLALGFGEAVRTLTRQGWFSRCAALAFVLLLGLALTADTVGWYARLGWLENGLTPVRKAARDPVRDRIKNQEPTHLFGDYWLVYRTSFLTGGQVVGVPYPIYPNRFPGWSAGLRSGQGRLLVLDPAGQSMFSAAWERDGRDQSELQELAVTP